MVHDLRDIFAAILAVAAAYGLDEQFAQGFVVECDFAQYVKDFAAERCLLLLKLFEEPLKDLSLACLARNEVPQVADLFLADAVDPAEALFESVGVPRKVVVYHEVRALESLSLLMVLSLRLSLCLWERKLLSSR